MNSVLFQMYLVRAERFHERLEQWLFAETRVFDAMVLTSHKPLSATRLPNGNYKSIIEMKPWGKLWDSGYFQLKGEIPEEWRGAEVWLDLQMGGEILLYDGQYHPVAQLTNTCIQIRNFRKTLFPAQLTAQPGPFTFYAEVAVNGFSNTMDGDTGLCTKLRYGKFNREVWNLLNDFRTLFFLLQYHQRKDEGMLPPPYTVPGGYHWDRNRISGPRNHRAQALCMTLNEAIDVFAENPANATAARAVLAHELSRPAQSSEHATVAVGHAHLDCGYLWKLQETVRKACRTFAGQLFNIQFYPGYVFGMSQPQVYEWVRERMPMLFNDVKAAVKNGTWEVQGGMWVEADTMMPSGESLIRQFIHGKNYWKEHFGVDVTNVWLPDGFGFSGALPQIMKACGCRYLTSQKISWNEFNEFPYHSFRWRGLDGSEVLVHFLPEENYNAFLEPSTLRWGEDNFHESHLAPEFLTLFGSGDGGGGPKMEHIEAGLRNANLEDTPRLSFGRACDFFSRMEAYADKLPLWDGEILLEFHRGTLTNQGRTKHWLRTMEQKTAAIEMLMALGPKEIWPRQELDAIWKRMLLFQFHDIITGTSLREVMEVVETDFAAMSKQEDGFVIKFITNCCSTRYNTVTFLHSMNCPYTRLLRLPKSWLGHAVYDAEGKELPIHEDGGQIFAKCALPPLSTTTLYRGGKVGRAPVEWTQDCTEWVLENSRIRCAFRENGEMSSLYDKRLKREMLGKGGANRLSLHVDMPRIFEGWEVEYADRDVPPEFAHAIAKPVMAIAPLRSAITFTLAIGKSTILQTAVLEDESSCVDFVTQVDWRETQRRLRMTIETDNDATEAVGEVQHGFVRRCLHTNTSQELGKFEHIAHRWYDLSDDRGGIACLNNGRYAHSCSHNQIQLTLLRSPLQVDVTHDNGIHTFTYSLYSHTGDFREGKVAEAAYQLNREPLRLDGVSAIPALPFQLKGDGIDVDAFKRAERSDDHILRLHEYHGRHSEAQLILRANVKPYVCDALEWTKGTPLKAQKDGIVPLSFKPFEFITIRLACD